MAFHISPKEVVGAVGSFQENTLALFWEMGITLQ